MPEREYFISLPDDCSLRVRYIKRRGRISQFTVQLEIWTNMETGSIALTSEEIADKIFDLTEQFHRYVFAHPDLLDEIPGKAISVVHDFELY